MKEKNAEIKDLDEGGMKEKNAEIKDLDEDENTNIGVFFPHHFIVR